MRMNAAQVCKAERHGLNSGGWSSNFEACKQARQARGQRLTVRRRLACSALYFAPAILLPLVTHGAYTSSSCGLLYQQATQCRWNYTTSPGWTAEEKKTLMLLLQVYGIGNWGAIVESGMLPGKKITQMNGQTQRLLGQQSMAGACRLPLTWQAVPDCWIFTQAAQGAPDACSCLSANQRAEQTGARKHKSAA